MLPVMHFKKGLLTYNSSHSELDALTLAWTDYNVGSD